MKSYYGYCYTCPETKLLDYVGIGHEVDDANLGERMRSHLKSSHNRMLRQKINALRSAGLEPLFAKSVDGLTRSAIVKWEATTIRNAGVFGMVPNRCSMWPATKNRGGAVLSTVISRIFQTFRNTTTVSWTI